MTPVEKRVKESKEFIKKMMDLGASEENAVSLHAKLSIMDEAIDLYYAHLNSRIK